MAVAHTCLRAEPGSADDHDRGVIEGVVIVGSPVAGTPTSLTLFDGPRLQLRLRCVTCCSGMPGHRWAITPYCDANCPPDARSGAKLNSAGLSLFSRSALFEIYMVRDASLFLLGGRQTPLPKSNLLLQAALRRGFLPGAYKDALFTGSHSLPKYEVPTCRLPCPPSLAFYVKALFFLSVHSAKMPMCHSSSFCFTRNWLLALPLDCSCTQD